MNFKGYPRRLIYRWERPKIFQKYLRVSTEKVFGVRNANLKLFLCLYFATGCCDIENTVLYIVYSGDKNRAEIGSEGL